jgi:hypothetical protein
MKNQYFGDVNDYRKYGLLRAWQAAGDGTLLVAWMLTPDDGTGDGRLRSYLKDPDKWRKYDPDLFDGLADLLRRARPPSVSLIERSGLLPRASYYERLVPDKREERDKWREDLLRSAEGVDLVFLDPDNGIEVPSRPVGRKGSSKYVTWEELKRLWDAGCSLLIYQHFPREKRDLFARRLVSELRDRTRARFVEAFRTPRVLFLLAAQNRHEDQLRGAMDLLSKHWNGQIAPVGARGQGAAADCLRRRLRGKALGGKTNKGDKR